MKYFIKNYFISIPLALGSLLTLFSVVNAMDLSNDDKWVSALLLGVIGIPLFYASVLSLLKE